MVGSDGKEMGSGILSSCLMLVGIKVISSFCSTSAQGQVKAAVGCPQLIMVVT